MVNTTIEHGITEQEAWLIVTNDVVHTIAELLPRLSEQTKTEINKHLVAIGAGYDDWEDLARRAVDASDHIDPEN